ncbi:MAG: rod shape-determining protein MreD [Thermovirgaceae bacterium]
MIPAALFWYAQDLLQVLMEGWAFAPDLFLFYLLFRCSKTPEDETTWIWTAFLGGILWDFRWSGLLGLNAAAYGGLLALFSIFWKRIPFTGRSHWIFMGFLAAAHGALALSRIIFYGIASREVAFAFVVQMMTAVPVISIVGFVFASHGEKRNVG